MSPQDLLQKAARNGDIEGIRRALASGANPRFQDSRPLQLAAKNGNIACVRELAPMSDAKALDSLALQFAAAKGHTDCVKLLTPISDTNAARAKLNEDDDSDAVALLDSVIQEEALKVKHLKPKNEQTRAGL